MELRCEAVGYSKVVQSLQGTLTEFGQQRRKPSAGGNGLTQQTRLTYWLREGGGGESRRYDNPLQEEFCPSAIPVFLGVAPACFLPPPPGWAAVPQSSRAAAATLGSRIPSLESQGGSQYVLSLHLTDQQSCGLQTAKNDLLAGHLSQHLWCNWCSVLTCCEMVHGMRSPAALLPRERLLITEEREIAPSRHT